MLTLIGLIHHFILGGSLPLAFHGYSLLFDATNIIIGFVFGVLTAQKVLTKK